MQYGTWIRIKRRTNALIKNRHKVTLLLEIVSNMACCCHKVVLLLEIICNMTHVAVIKWHWYWRLYAIWHVAVVKWHCYWRLYAIWHMLLTRYWGAFLLHWIAQQLAAIGDYMQYSTCCWHATEVRSYFIELLSSLQLLPFPPKPRLSQLLPPSMHPLEVLPLQGLSLLTRGARQYHYWRWGQQFLWYINIVIDSSPPGI